MIFGRFQSRRRCLARGRSWLDYYSISRMTKVDLGGRKKGGHPLIKKLPKWL